MREELCCVDSLRKGYAHATYLFNVRPVTSGRDQGCGFTTLCLKCEGKEAL